MMNVRGMISARLYDGPQLKKFADLEGQVDNAVKAIIIHDTRKLKLYTGCFFCLAIQKRVNKEVKLDDGLFDGKK